MQSGVFQTVESVRKVTDHLQVLNVGKTLSNESDTKGCRGYIPVKRCFGRYFVFLFVMFALELYFHHLRLQI